MRTVSEALDRLKVSEAELGAKSAMLTEGLQAEIDARKKDVAQLTSCHAQANGSRSAEIHSETQDMLEHLQKSEGELYAKVAGLAG